MLNRTTSLLIATAGLLASAMPASAALLGFNPGEPVTEFGSLSGQGLSYDAGSGAFTASGIPLDVFFSGALSSAPVSGDRGLSISLTLDHSGNASGGAAAQDFALWGEVSDGITLYSGLLLSGSVLDFGFQDVTSRLDVFDMLFDVTGGSMASLFGGDFIGLFLVAERSSFGGDFTVDFASSRIKGSIGIVPNGNPGGGVDAVVPAPGTLWLAGLTLGLVRLVRRR